MITTVLEDLQLLSAEFDDDDYYSISVVRMACEEIKDLRSRLANVNKAFDLRAKMYCDLKDKMDAMPKAENRGENK